MQKFILHIIVVLASIASAFGQIGTGEWRIHSQNSNAKSIARVGNSIYTAFDAAILEYDLNYNETSELSIVNGLSDLQISTMGVHEASKSVVVGYLNGNIDIIKNGRITNIPSLKLANVVGVKTIYSIKSHANLVYLATGIGIIVIDPYRLEVKDTYYPSSLNEGIKEITFLGDSIFALSNTRLYKANVNHPTLADVNQWIVDTRLPILSDPNYSYNDIEAFNDSLYFSQKFEQWGNDSLFVAKYSGRRMAYELENFGEIISLSVVGNRLVLSGDGILTLFNPDFSTSLFMQEYSPGKSIQANQIVSYENEIWIADARFGLKRHKPDGSFESVTFQGPSENKFFASKYFGGMMAVVPGAPDGIGESYFPPAVMFFEDEKWTSIRRDDQALWLAGKTYDISSVSQNPLNKNQFALSSFSKTPLTLVDRSNATIIDTFSSFNAPLVRTLNGSIYLSASSYDDKGNLWILNGYDVKPLKVRDANGNWSSFSLGSAGANKLSKKLFIDYNQNIWTAFPGSGLVGYNPGSDPLSASDDKIVTLNSGGNTGALPTNNVTAIAMDFDNELWIGTDSGFGILYNSENAFSAGLGEYNVQRPKVQINGETDYILNNVYITDIEVDGGNRKWIATSNSGMILLSEDGLTIIEHFTMDNSPLVSNSILDLEINHKTGEIFVVTELGLMSYRGDASYEDPEYSDVTVFPNPARPDFDGLITIQGIRYNSDIKITDVSGKLVYKTTSNGGTATWNGKTMNGEKVASGVYLIWTASNITKGRYVGKVVVVN